MFNQTVKEIGRHQAKQIIKVRHPVGKYWLSEENGKFVGIDNSTGDAWTEDFDTKQECIDWLEGRFQIGDMHD